MTANTVDMLIIHVARVRAARAGQAEQYDAGAEGRGLR